MDSQKSTIEDDAMSSLNVYGARVHNLKNINVTIPHGELCVITGLSGSGKSSLAFDTIFAEGQRRYIETFSSYARNLLGNLERPDVDEISGLSPVIAIEQKTVNRNPRSTIGTTTEIYDFLRLLYANVATAVSYLSGEPMIKYTEERIVNLILDRFSGKKIYILAPLVKNRKGHYKELFETVRKKGYLTVRVDGELREIVPEMKLDRYRNHFVEVVIDRLKVSDKDLTRLRETVTEALRQGEKQLMVYDVDDDNIYHYSQQLMDPSTGISYREPAPHNFSFNSPQGACPRCKGLGEVNLIDNNKIMPNPSLSIAQGGILPLGKYTNTMIFWQIEAICKTYGHTLKTPVGELCEEAIDEILNGTDRHLVINNATMSTSNYFKRYEGIVKYIELQQDDDAGAAANKWSDQFFSRAKCPECNGQRLNREALHFFIDDYQFDRIWNNPERYIDMFLQYDYICSPDYSLFTDFPKTLQIYNTYKKQFLGALFQSYGVKVVPTVSWSDENSFEWCFDGIEHESCVSCSSVGCMRNKEAKQLFINGFNYMMKTINPEKVLMVGKLPDELEEFKDKCVFVTTFQEEMRERMMKNA